MEELQGQRHPQLHRDCLLAGCHRGEVYGDYEELFRGQLCGELDHCPGCHCHLVSHPCLPLRGRLCY